MNKIQPSVYIESSVISYYSSKPSRDLIVAAHQQITTEWWESSLPNFDAYISQVVLDEIRQGDTVAADRREKSVEPFAVLEMRPDIAKLAYEYFSEIKLADKKRADSFHLALAAWHGIDYLVSWNCIHIASARVRKIVERINEKHGIDTPVICTPEELMEV
jgi:predicted nucleic acid-binding protein